MLVLNSRSIVFSTLVSLLILSTAGPATASDQITISSKIPYLNDNVGSGNIQNECTWNSTMPAALVAQSKGTVVSTDHDMTTVTGKKLIITATHVHAIGGGGFSGPKWITLEGKLTENGKLLGNFQLKRTTGGGGLRFGGCKILEYISKALTQDVLKWLKNPQIMAAPAPAPATAPAETAK